MHTLELLRPTEDKETRLAKQAFKPQAHIIEIVAPSSDDEDENEQSDVLLARRLSKQEEREAEEELERTARE